MTKASNSIAASFLKRHHQPCSSATTVILLAAILCSPAIMFLHFPHSITFPITVRYPRCNHIVLVSTMRHGSTWFISNTEQCLSVNGSYGNLTKNTEIWNHGKVKNISLEEAIGLVQFNTSVKIFPNALYEHSKDVRAFFEAMRDLQVPIFVLRRNLENSFASLLAARKSKLWLLDNSGAPVERKLKMSKRFLAYRNRTETYFKDAKKLMNDVGIDWDEVQYETILSQHVILGKTAGCYIRNCNFT